MSKSNYLQKNSFIDLNEPELIKLMQEVGGESFRINQINNWIYNNYVRFSIVRLNDPWTLSSQGHQKWDRELEPGDGAPHCTDPA